MRDLMSSWEADLLRKQGKSILIVEDDRDIRQALQMVLDEVGFDTFTAANGKEALELLPRMTTPSLILLDLMMPVMNGWEFEKEIAKDDRYRHIPIIVLTALHGKVQSIKHKDLMRKPIDFDSLVPVIKYHFLREILEPKEPVFDEDRCQLKFAY